MHILPFVPDTSDTLDFDDEFRTEMLGRLARLLLNPELDRCDIADGILGDPELIEFLRPHDHIVLQKFVPPGTSWQEMQCGEFTFSSITHDSGETRGTFVMPLLVGCLVDENRQAWFQASPHEFVPAIEGIKTSNLCGKPLFRTTKGRPMSDSSISAKEKFSDGIFRCFQLC